MCKFCMAEMFLILLEKQECCAKAIERKNEMLAVELIKYLQMLIERRN